MEDNFNPYHAWLGIPPAEQPADYYRLLGVSRFETNADVISNAADARMVYVRTFQSSQRGPISQKILNELSAAKICLLDAQKKAAYDKQLQAKLAQAAAAQQAALQPKPIAGLRPLGPAQTVAPKPMVQAKPLSAQPLSAQPSPQQGVAGGPAYNPLNPLVPLNQAATPFPGPATFHQNVANTPKKATPVKANPAWLMPAIIGGGVVLTAILVIVAVTVAMISSGKQQVAKVSPGKNSAAIPANVSPQTTADPAVANTPPPNPFIPQNTTPKPPPANQFVPGVTSPSSSSGLPVISGNLLNTFPSSRMIRVGESILNNGELSLLPGKGGHTQLIFPLSIPEDYDLITTAVRETGADGLVIGFSMGGVLDTITVDGWPQNGFLTGITKIDNRALNTPSYPAAMHRGQLLKNGVPGKIVARVRKNSLVLTVDEKDVVSWVGPPTQLSLDFTLQRPPNTLALATWQSRFRITQFEMRPASANPSTAVAVVPPVPPANNPPAVNPFNPPANVQAGDSRMVWRSKPGPRICVIMKTPAGWIEHSNGMAFQYQEQQRNDQFIELYDAGRRTGARLYADRCDVGSGTSWGTLYSGGWIGGGPMPNRGGPPPQITTAPSAVYTPTSQGYCVRLQGAGRIELANPEELTAPAEPRTYEGWFRMLNDEPNGMVFGSFPPILKNGEGGFHLRILKKPTGTYVNVEVQRDRGRHTNTANTKNPLTANWYHIALNSNWQDDLQVFINGESVVRQPAVIAKNNTSSLFWLGTSPLAKNDPNHWAHSIQVDLGAFRISRGMRYTTNFTPPATLAQDADTLALLDFSKDTGNVINDSAGNAHTGTISGGLWVPFSGAAVNVAANTTPLANPNPFNPPPNPFETDAPPPRTTLADVKKAKPPDEATYAKKQEEVNVVFGDEIKKAKKPEDKVGIAQRLVDAARKLLDDLDARYVMLDEARTLAAEGNHLTLALQTIDTMAQSYEFNATNMRLDTLKKAGSVGSTNDQRRQVLDALVQLANSTAEEGNFDVATDAADFMAELAKKGKATDSLKTGAELKAEIARKKKVADEIRQTEEQLATDPNDADANLKAGRYYCFVRNDWARGLKYLAKGGNDDIAKAARLEQEAAGMPDAQIVAAEAWDKAADSVSKTEKPFVQRRAHGLYSAAIPSLTGLTKIRTQQKLDVLSDQLAFSLDIHLPTKVTQSNGLLTEAYSGMIGRVVVGTRDTGILVRYLPGRQVRQEKLNKLVQETKAPNVAAITIQLIGTVSLSQDATLYGNQRFEANMTGGMRLLLDRKEVSVVKATGDGGSRARSLQTPKGDHEIGWELVGETANCELNIRQDNSFGALATVYYTKDSLEGLRRKLSKGGKPKEFDLCD